VTSTDGTLSAHAVRASGGPEIRVRFLVPDGNVGGTNTIAYCRDIGPTTVVLRAVDTSGSRSGPSNELNIVC
jgi:hypothetical protein